MDHRVRACAGRNDREAPSRLRSVGSPTAFHRHTRHVTSAAFEARVIEREVLRA